MIEGIVNANYEAVIILVLQGHGGQAQEVDAVIDTGYNGTLTLPPTLIAELGLPFIGEGRAFLANGEEETFDVYGVTVLWDGRARYIETDAVGMDPLVGMSLMDNHSLYMEIRDGGRVVIQSVERT